MRRSFSIALFVSLTVSSLPLACGDDESSPGGDDSGSGGSGADATGGTSGQGARGGANPTGGTAGSATGGRGGNTRGGSGGRASGGSGGTSGGGAPGGEGGEGATGGDSDGGIGGATGGGAGGEGGVDERTARCQRICRKTEPLMCPDASGCVEDFCEVYYNRLPSCRPYADAALICLDERATPDEFVCWIDKPAAVATPESTCWEELFAVLEAGC